MATTYTAAVAPMGAVAIHHAVGAIMELIATVREWNNTRRTIAVLSRLNDSQLEDIGLTKGDVAEFGNKRF